MIFQAQSRMIFGLQGEDADTVARELASLTFDPKRIKEEIYVSRFGADDYAEVQRIRRWLDTKTNREELLAYLTDKDPYGV